jgi:hypothetical protein
VKRIVILIVVIVTAAVSGQSPSVRVGAGGVSCGRWLEIREQGDSMESHVADWIDGFLVGSALASSQFVLTPNWQMPDTPTERAFVDKYCRDHPLDSVTRAAVVLYNEVKRKALAP